MAQPDDGNLAGLDDAKLAGLDDGKLAGLVRDAAAAGRPTRMVFVDELPHSGVGKVAKGRLRAAETGVPG